MNILAMDTTGPALSVAVSRDRTILCEILINTGLKHSQTLMPAVDEALQRSGLSLREIELVAAVAGPGSFTGVRIGVCAAKALCRSNGQPALALNALETLAAGTAVPGQLVAPILDARRGQVYCALFRVDEEGLPRRLCPDGAMELKDFLTRLPEGERVVFAGDAVPVHGNRVRQLIGDRAVLLPEHLSGLRAGAACRLARARAGQATDARELLPIYARASQAERERRAREEAKSRG